MGLTAEKITSFVAYWLSVFVAFFGATTPQDFAAYAGTVGVALTVYVNWYYRRKSYLLIKSGVINSGVINGLNR